MNINSMPIGSKLFFGHVRTGLDNRIRWVKVSENNDFVTYNAYTNSYFDRSEPLSPSRARRNQGNNYYPHSNIHQWLNARENTQWQSMHEFDRVPNGIIHDGFSNQFTDLEYAMIIEREIDVVTPPGSKKQFPATSKMNVKVTLPAASEIDEGFECQEGTFLPELRKIAERSYELMTRTGFKDPSHIVAFSGRDRYYAPASDYLRIHPMIRLSPDADIVSSDMGDEQDECFEILLPEAVDCDEYLRALNDIVFMAM